MQRVELLGRMPLFRSFLFLSRTTRSLRDRNLISGLARRTRGSARTADRFAINRVFRNCIAGGGTTVAGVFDSAPGVSGCASSTETRALSTTLLGSSGFSFEDFSS